MRHLKKYITASITLILIVLFLSHKKVVHTSANIIESSKLSTVLDYIDTKNTLVIFDIDNTLARSVKELSSDEWFCHLVDTKMAQGFDYLTSVYYALPAAYYAQFNVPLKPTEPRIPELIQHLVDNGIAVMALSTRSLFIAERTLEQLDNINIHFFIPNLDPNDLVLPMKHPCFYKRGVLLAGNNDKGEVLECFFNSMNYHPDKIIFVDDKKKYLLSVQKIAEKLGIDFCGIRYSGCDELVKNFDAAKAEEQHRELKEKNSCLAKA